MFHLPARAHEAGRAPLSRRSDRPDAPHREAPVFGGCGDPTTKDVEIHHNPLVNNDVGIHLNNFNDACNGPSDTPTRLNVHHNTLSNAAVTNTSGFDGANGYQVGIDDTGNRDHSHHNDIAGPATRLPIRASVRAADRHRVVPDHQPARAPRPPSRGCR